MIEVEYKTVAAAAQRALICGNTELTNAVAKEFASRNIPAVIADTERSNSSEIKVEDFTFQNLAARGPMSAANLLRVTGETIGETTILVNICCPDANRDRVSLLDYADDLMQTCTEAANRMVANGIPGCIINHCVLPVMYAGTKLEDQMSILRGAITGVTRSIARKYGKQGIRCIGVQTGLIETEECKSWLSDKLSQIDIPGKRWGAPRDVAKMIGFLSIDGTYITGQTIILDGGLTAGISGI